MADSAKKTPKIKASQKEPQQQPIPEETPMPTSGHAPDVRAGAEPEKGSRQPELETTKESTPQDSATRGGSKRRHRHGRNRSKASESEYDSTAERAALGPPNRRVSKPDRPHTNGTPVARTIADLQSGESGTETTLETISGGRRNRQGRGQEQVKRVNKQDNLEISGVVNGRPLNGTEGAAQERSDSESTAGSTVHSDSQTANSGRRHRRRKRGTKSQANNAPLPSITEDHTGGEREEKAVENGTGQSGQSAIVHKGKVEVKEEPLRLKLEFNMDVDVEIKAKISGDLTLNMYGKAEFGELKVQLDHVKF